MSQWNCLRLEICILDSLLRQWNGVLKILMLRILGRFLKFAINFKIFEHFCPFLSLTILTGQRKLLSLGLHDKYLDAKNVFEHFLYCDMWKIFFWILRFQFFLYGKKLLALSQSLSVLAGISFLLFLAHGQSSSLSLSLSLSLSPIVDAALQRLLCGMMSPSITLISGPFNQTKTNPTKQWIGTDEANPSPVVWEQFARR